MFSAFAVDPTMSVKRTVMSFRSSVVGACGASGAAHARQNFAMSGLSCPQLAQMGMLRVSLRRWGSARRGRFNHELEPAWPEAARRFAGGFLLFAGFADRAGTLAPRQPLDPRASAPRGCED